ncbi:NlpC/P60 family protein [Phaeobacter gallaeciensis]|uniref:NlpC/P60 family protein n=1 Tax=Phaeobacter gallaeciensis TaxID=60890 RepID=UPI0003D6C2E7|nr:NlpC/P60 family protein [Phaeobacter gallaeciensis]AHD12138.1 NlpC/P60 family [Phaeobacter gallaeciensis DSM 26640]ATE95322.1 NlpC/P60 family protein [Phaeobacter gallaeciensis]
MWQGNWVGLRYEKLGRGPETYDCLGLWLALQKARMARNIPDPRCTMLQAAREQTANQFRPLFTRVSHAQEGDALMFRVRGQLLHVGYAIDTNDMLHIEEDATGSVLECWNRSPWIGRLEGIYRFVEEQSHI